MKIQLVLTCDIPPDTLLKMGTPHLKVESDDPLLQGKKIESKLTINTRSGEIIVDIDVERGMPPLIVDTHRFMTEEARHHLRHALNSFLANPGKTLVIEDGMDVYQCIDGRWQPINGPLLTESEQRDLQARFETPSES